MLYLEILAELAAESNAQNKETMVMLYGKANLISVSMCLAVVALISNDALAACPGNTQMEMN